MTKIAIINTNGVSWGGCDPIWAEAANSAISNGHKVFISTVKFSKKPKEIIELENKGAKFFFRNNYKSIYTRIVNKIFRSVHINDTLIPIFRHVNNFKPDVVFINLAGGFEFVGDLAIFKLIIKSKVPIHLMVHNYLESYIPDIKSLEILNLGFSIARNVFFTSQHQLDGISHKIMYSKTNFKVIGNPISFEPTIIEYPDDEITNFGLPGSLAAQRKGQDIVILLLGEQQWKNRKWRLNIYGSGPDERYLKMLVEYYDLKKYIIFHGHITNIKTVWEQNHIAILPSRQDSGPLTAVEAMACGRPVIGTNIGLMADLIDNKSGFISDVANLNSFRKVLEEAWQQKSN